MTTFDTGRRRDDEKHDPRMAIQGYARHSSRALRAGVSPRLSLSEWFCVPRSFVASSALQKDRFTFLRVPYGMVHLLLVPTKNVVTLMTSYLISRVKVLEQRHKSLCSHKNRHERTATTTNRETPKQERTEQQQRRRTVCYSNAALDLSLSLSLFEQFKHQFTQTESCVCTKKTRKI